GEFSERDNQAIRRVRFGKLIEGGIGLLCLAAQIDRLAQKHLLQPRIRDRSADLESCAGRETGDTLGRAQTKALIDFRVEPDFGALPEFDAQTQRRVPALAALV